MRPWMALLVLGCNESTGYESNDPPEARIISHTAATTVFTNVETEFLGEATDVDQPNTSLTAHWTIEGTIGCRSAPILKAGGATRCKIIIRETGLTAVSLEVIDNDGESAIHELTLQVVAGVAPGSTDLVVGDDNNYSALGGVDIVEIDVEPGGDVNIDWCSLTADDRGRDVPDPSLIDRVELREFPYVPEDIEDFLGRGIPILENASSTWIFYNGGNICSTALTNFRDGSGVQIDPMTYLLGNGRTWMVYPHYNDTLPTFDPVSSAFMVAGFSNNLNATLDDNSSTWGFAADLLSLEHVATVADRDDYTLDWSDVTRNILGNSFEQTVANKLFIAKTSEDLVSLQPLVLAIEDNSDEFYRMNVGGAISADLMAAESADGTAFAGFTEDGLWLVGIECASCEHPAPLFLTVVDVQAATP